MPTKTKTKTQTKTQKSHEIETKAVAVIDQYKEYKVVDQKTLDQAGLALGEIKGARKRLEDLFRPMIRKADEATKAIRANFKKFDVPLKNCEDNVKYAIGAFDEAEEKKRAAIQAAAEKAAKEETERLAEESLQKMEDERLGQAADLEDAGYEQAADDLMEQPLPDPEPVAPPPVVLNHPPKAKTAGVSTTKIYNAEVFDLLALAAAVASGTAPASYIMANMPSLNSMAKAQKEELAIPGVRAIYTTSVSKR